MKVLFVMTQAFDPFSGGIQMTTYKLSKKFTEMGIKSIVYSFNNTGHIRPEYTRLCFSEKENLHHNKENRDHFYESVKDENPDFIISQMPYEEEINRVILELKNELKCVTLACLRNSLFSVKLNIDHYIVGAFPSPLNKLFRNAIGRFIFQKLHKAKHAKSLISILDQYDRFVMFGEPNNDEIRYFIGDYKEEKLVNIPNSIPHVEEEVPKKERRILWLSRLSYGQKQAHLILPVWQKIKKQLPDWELDIVGDGDAFEDISHQIKMEKISRVTLYGKQNPDYYYKRSPIYFMTSAYEGFPNTIIEAQSFGCIPIVFSSYPIAAWVLNENQDGFLIKPYDIGKMAKSILNLATNPEKMTFMSNMALKNADRFQVDKVGEMWKELFNKFKDSK